MERMSKELAAMRAEGVRNGCRREGEAPNDIFDGAGGERCLGNARSVLAGAQRLRDEFVPRRPLEESVVDSTRSRRSVGDATTDGAGLDHRMRVAVSMDIPSSLI